MNNTINSTKNNKLKDNITSATSNINTLKKALGLGAIYAGLRKTASTIKDIAKENIDMIETNNLFEVSMGKVVDKYGNLDTQASKYYTKAMDFQNQMNEKLATNKSELEEYQAMYYSMFKGQGINKDASYTMSESLTKAGYDIASLYNLSVKDAMDKIKSGIAGQVESLRTIGIDVSESSLSKVLNEVGIDRSVQQLSYAEKEVARYIAIIEQAGQAQGDFAKTFESPANQIRVFQNQLIELKQVAGSFIVNAFGGIIVWANAIIMAIKEIIKSIASLFGYDLSSGGSNNLADSIGVSDLNNGLGGATKKAKELKKQLMGFDEINNIDPASTTGGSGGSGGVATGVDDKLLKSLKEWDNKMNSITGKAQEYRDAILKALGFTRDIDGNLKWHWKDMNNILKVLTVIAGIVGGILIIGKITKLVNWLKTLFTILKTGKGATTTFGLGLQTIGKIILGLKSGFTNLGAWISMAVGQYKIFRAQGNGVISSLKLTKSALAETGQGFSSLISTGVKVGVGLTGLVASSALAYKSMKDLNEGSISTTEGMLKLAGSLAGATASGALIGSVFGPAGMAIGAFAGFAISATSAVIGAYNASSKYHDEVKNLKNSVSELSKEIEENTKKYEENKKNINSNLEDKMAELGVYQTLIAELGKYVDANGKVISGNERRIDYILGELSKALGIELSRNGDLITKNGEVVSSYKTLQNELSNTIQKLKEEAETEALKELYKNSIKQKIKDQNELNKAIEKEAEAYNILQKVTDSGASKWSKDYKDAKKSLEEASDTVNTLRDNVANDTKDISNYSSQLTQKVVDDTNSMTLQMMEQGEVTEKQMQNIVSSNWSNWESVYNQANTITQEMMLAQSTTIDTWSPELAKKWSDMADSSKENFLQGISDVDAKTASKILSSINVTNENKPAMAEAWKQLAKKSKDEFDNSFSSLSQDTQNLIIGSITTTETLTPQMQMKWHDLAKTSKDKYNEQLSLVDDDTRKSIEDANKIIDQLSPSEQEKLRNLAKNSKEKYQIELSKMQQSTENAMSNTAGSINRNRSVSNSASSLGSNVKLSYERNLGDGNNSARNFLLGFTRVLSSGGMGGPVGIFYGIASLTRRIVSKFNAGLGNHSPSKKTRKSAIFFAQGFTNQIRKSSLGMISQVGNLATDMTDNFSNNIGMVDTIKELNQGIKVNTRDMAIDTTQYVNYGAISGQIQAQSKVSLGNISDQIYNAVVSGMEKAKVQVDINAKTDEGVIVEKASEGFRDYVTRTGELPFPVPV